LWKRIFWPSFQIPEEESSDDSEYLINVSGSESVGSSTSLSDDEDKSSDDGDGDGDEDSNDDNDYDPCDEATVDVRYFSSE